MGKYFTERERYKLEGLLQAKISVKDIAVQLNKTVQTIYNEIKRGTVELLDPELAPYKKYCADVAQRKYDENKIEKGRPLKVGNDLEFVKFIENKIKNEKYSPKAIIYTMLQDNAQFKTSVCWRTIYNYIYHGVFLNVTTSDLPHKSNYEKKKEKDKIAHKNLKGTSIEERPKEILERDTYGHWEMDTVYSGKGKGKDCLLVLSERMTRQEIILKMKNRTLESVVKAVNKLEKSYGYTRFTDTFKTITVDNGVEFLDFSSLEKSVTRKNKVRTKLYYCHPFCSGERGTNENINKMIRRWIPKGESIKDYTPQQIKKIEDWINNYPREIFGGLSSNQYRKLLNLT